MKYFLLIAGQGYYPQPYTEDWVGTFASYEEASSKIKTTEEHEYFSKGPRKGEIKSTRSRYTIDEREVDWYDIVDLRQWI